MMPRLVYSLLSLCSLAATTTSATTTDSSYSFHYSDDNSDHRSLSDWDCTDIPFPDYVGDGYCDGDNNVDPCYDGGDCCESTCVSSEDYACGDFGYDCVDPSGYSTGDGPFGGVGVGSYSYYSYSSYSYSYSYTLAPEVGYSRDGEIASGTCASAWITDDGGTCGETQYGCPPTACDGDSDGPWCMDENLFDWFYCAYSHSFGETAAPSATRAPTASTAPTATPTVTAAPSEKCLDVVMSDSWGDGWTRAVLTVSDTSDAVLFTGQVDLGSTRSERLCLEDGCYLASVSDDDYPSDVSFAIDGHEGSGAPYGPMAFFVSGGGVADWGSLCNSAAPTATPAPTASSLPTIAPTESCLDVVMSDSYGDGWTGAVLTVTEADEGTVVFTGSVDVVDDYEYGGSYLFSYSYSYFNISSCAYNSNAPGCIQTDSLCLEDGCYLASVSEDDYPSEVSFTIDGYEGSGAPYGPAAFFVSGGGVADWDSSCDSAPPTARPRTGAGPPGPCTTRRCSRRGTRP